MKKISKRNKSYKSCNTALYKHLRNQMVSEVRIAKKNFYHDQVRPAFCKDQHVWWKNINMILGKKKQIITLVDPETDLLLDEKQSANHINDIFC